MLREKIYFRNISRRWKQEINSSDDTVIVSPYVTSNTAITVTKNINPERCELYTLFDADLFINGSSSINTLIKLASIGVRIYHLENLHAKIVICSDSFASIGSQNLTARGTKNLEASITITDKKEVIHIRNQLNVWFSKRIPISIDMLLNMKSKIGPIIKEYKKLSWKAKNIEREIVEGELIRLRKVKEEQERLERERREQTRIRQEALEKRKQEVYKKELQRKVEQSRRKKLTELKKAVQISKKANYSKRGVVRYVGENGNKSLVIADGSKLTSWMIDNEFISLRRFYRYLCLDESTGKIGWVRLAGTRMTYFSQGVVLSEPIQIGRYLCDVYFTAVWDDVENSIDNINIKLTSPEYNIAIDCHGWFGLNSLHIRGFSSDNDTSYFASTYIDWLKTNESQVSLRLKQHLLAPFKYKAKLSGVQASTFLSSVGTQYHVTAAEILGQTIIITSPR